MIQLLASILVLLPPSPALCRSHGVDVTDQQPTGQIVEYHIADRSTVSARCQRPFSKVYGCAIPVMEDQYIIWVVDSYSARTHEECHAIYQVAQHTKRLTPRN
jgi:hypothetical protein